jgi:hypothetical protein
MHNTPIRSFKSSTLLIATSLLCCAGLGTAAQADHPGPAPFQGPGQACVVIRHSPVLHAGHIAWGVEIAQGRYVFGAVEDSSSNGSAGWSQEGTWDDMLAAFHHPGHTGGRYDAIKCIEVAQPNPAAAINVGSTMPERSKHYNVVTKNCLHATYAVIHAYGATHVPAPNWADMIPNKYYSDFKGHETRLPR